MGLIIIMGIIFFIVGGFFGGIASALFQTEKSLMIPGAIIGVIFSTACILPIALLDYGIDIGYGISGIIIGIVIIAMVIIILKMLPKVAEQVKKNNEAATKANKESISSLIKKTKALCDKSDYYLEKYKNDVEYEKLKTAFVELCIAYNRMAQQILATPTLGRRPVDPFVAAGIGNGLAGPAAGVVMGLSAQDKMNTYNDNLAQFNSNLAKIGTCEQKCLYLYDEITAIISRDIILNNNEEV